MSTRLIRLNELIQREISSYLRKRWASEATMITISDVNIAQDLKTCKVYVSIVGSPEQIEARFKWIESHTSELRREVGRHIVMKWTPELTLLLDATPDRAARVLQLLDEIEKQPKSTTE